MYKNFAQNRRSQALDGGDSAGVSVNYTDGTEEDMTTGLLQGDHDEEMRMADRLAEKAENAKEGKMKRASLSQIEEETSAGAQRSTSQADDAGLLLLPSSSSAAERGDSIARKLSANRRNTT